MTRTTGYFTADHVSPARRWRTRFKRQRGPLVRHWDHEFNHLHTEPIRVESWPAWLTRQARRAGIVR